MRSCKSPEVKIVSEELKRRIVEEIESGEIGQCEASRVYDINRGAIQKWLKLYGRVEHRRRVVEIVMKDEKEKIQELQQALSDAHLKIRLYDELFELAGSEYGVDIKKNFSGAALEHLNKKGKKSKGSAE